MEGLQKLREKNHKIYFEGIDVFTKDIFKSTSAKFYKNYHFILLDFNSMIKQYAYIYIYTYI